VRKKEQSYRYLYRKKMNGFSSLAYLYRKKMNGFSSLARLLDFIKEEIPCQCLGVFLLDEMDQVVFQYFRPQPYPEKSNPRRL